MHADRFDVTNKKLAKGVGAYMHGRSAFIKDGLNFLHPASERVLLGRQR